MGVPAPDPALAALSGPPRSFQVDADVFALTGSWLPLLEHLPREEWRLPLLLDLTHPDDAGLLTERLWDRDDPLSMVTVFTIVENLVQSATGHPYWVPARLLAVAASQWMDVDGHLLLHGVDLISLLDRSPARACSAIYAHLIKDRDEKQREKVDRDLFQMPPDLDAATAPDWMVEEEGAQFMAAMASFRRG